MKGLIIKNISDQYTVISNNYIYDCKAKGIFRHKKITPLVGDYVEIDENKKIIISIDSRRNELTRPPVSNVDLGFIITSTKAPDLDLNLLDKILMILEYNRIKPIIILTKLDILNKVEIEYINNIKDYYINIGYTVFENSDIEKIKTTFKDNTSVFIGQSGAGKSTLLNKIDINLALKTGEISQALNRGKHTTRHVELISVNDGYVADTPGFSSLDLSEYKKEDIRDNFIEFYNNSDLCQYKDCFHINEKQCNIKKLVEDKKILESRYDNYIKFINSIKKRW